MKLTSSIQLVRNMGLRYTFYRISHELERKLGILKKRHPINPPIKKFITLKDWRESTDNFIVVPKEKSNFKRIESQELKQKAERILNGEICFFSHQWKDLGRNYDWITNPDSGYKYDISKHWSEIPDLSPQAGDIKEVWEKSRFSYLLTIIRYDHHFNIDLSEFALSEIESWIDANPVNQGPNWRCSQEISLRIFNWLFVLNYYKNNKSLTDERWTKIQNVIYWSLHHVYNHINFSRIAVRNNHAITETLFLTLSNTLFPFMPETHNWAKKGKKWFEQEIDYQIYNDGTFLQFSMNYHRVVIQLLTLGISVGNKNQIKFEQHVYEKAYKSLDFLYQNLQEENGWLPNYGSNDGALFFPLTESDYRDYRPQLNTLHFILTGNHLYKEKETIEDSNWMNNSSKSIEQKKPIIQKKYGTMSYPEGGYYMLRTKETFTFIRCGNHKDRPAQADNLHIDIWSKGKNILRDSGTYKYNTDKEKLNYFMGTVSHNAVTVNDNSQMLKGGRFIWYYWTQKNNATWTEAENDYIFTGEIKAFRFLNKKATHKRIVKINKDKPQWIITDSVKELDDFSKKQIWHPNNADLLIESGENKSMEFDSYNSDYYGKYTTEKSLFYTFQDEIETKILLNNR